MGVERAKNRSPSTEWNCHLFKYNNSWNNTAIVILPFSAVPKSDWICARHNGISSSPRLEIKLWPNNNSTWWLLVSLSSTINSTATGYHSTWMDGRPGTVVDGQESGAECVACWKRLVHYYWNGTMERNTLWIDVLTDNKLLVLFLLILSLPLSWNNRWVPGLPLFPSTLNKRFAQLFNCSLVGELRKCFAMGTNERFS